MVCGLYINIFLKEQLTLKSGLSGGKIKQIAWLHYLVVGLDRVELARRFGLSTQQPHVDLVRDEEKGSLYVLTAY